MKHALLLSALVVISGNGAFAQPASRPRLLEEGDIVFQKLPCGGMCDAIIATTPCTGSERFNHCGIVLKKGDSTFVIEAIGSKVQRTVLAAFLKRDTNAVFTYGRVKQAASARVKAARAAERFVGRPYDDAFLPGDSALYCSELVYEVFPVKGKSAGRLFPLAPMTFKPAPDAPTHPAWTAYYSDIQAAIPEGEPGINPCALASSPYVKLFKVRRAGI